MKSLFMIKKAYVQTVRLKQAKFVRGVENVILVMTRLYRKIIDLTDFHHSHRAVQT
jgi:hypothetical protein